MNERKFNELVAEFIDCVDEPEHGRAFDFAVCGFEADVFNKRIKDDGYCVKVIHKRTMKRTFTKPTFFEIAFQNKKTKAIWQGDCPDYVRETLVRNSDAKSVTIYDVAIAKNEKELKKHEAAR